MAIDDYRTSVCGKCCKEENKGEYLGPASDGRLLEASGRSGISSEVVGEGEPRDGLVWIPT